MFGFAVLLVALLRLIHMGDTTTAIVLYFGVVALFMDDKLPTYQKFYMLLWPIYPAALAFHLGYEYVKKQIK
jgi:hypothetical protein